MKITNLQANAIYGEQFNINLCYIMKITIQHEFVPCNEDNYSTQVYYLLKITIQHEFVLLSYEDNYSVLYAI